MPKTKEDDSHDLHDLLVELGLARPELNATIRRILDELIVLTVDNQTSMLASLQIYPRHGSPRYEKAAFAKWDHMKEFDRDRTDKMTFEDKDKAFYHADLILRAAGVGMTKQQLKTLRLYIALALHGIDVEKCGAENVEKVWSEVSSVKKQIEKAGVEGIRQIYAQDIQQAHGPEHPANPGPEHPTCPCRERPTDPCACWGYFFWWRGRY